MEKSSVQHPFALVEAFCTASTGSGNPAGVVIVENWPAEDWMQKAANTLNQAETAFVGPGVNNPKIRWFTPSVEVRLCGHATLAAARIWLDQNEKANVTFESLSGNLSVERHETGLCLNFPSYPPVKKSKDCLAHVFPSATQFFKDRDDWIAILNDEKEVKEFEPEYDKITDLGGRGVSITAQGTNTDFVYRFFAPLAGVNEDHATGSAQTYLAPLWAQMLQKSELTSAQLSPRGGLFRSQIVNDRVKIIGQTNIVVFGTLHEKD